jgi:hypothetical protein
MGKIRNPNKNHKNPNIKKFLLGLTTKNLKNIGKEIQTKISILFLF